MTDEERAAEAVYVLRLTDEPHDPWSLAILGACYAGSWVKREAAEAFAGEIRRRFLLHVAAVRAEEREAAEARVRTFTDLIAHRWTLLPHNSSDAKARDVMIGEAASGKRDPAADLAAIRARGQS